MDRGIRAVWYDLPQAGEEAYLAWLHDVHLPELVKRHGYAWGAHYRITDSSPRMREIHDRLARPDDSNVGTGTDFLLLLGASSPHDFCDPTPARVEEGTSADTRDMLSKRIGARACIFVEEAKVNGPEARERQRGTAPGPAIQMGSFRTKTEDDEFDLCSWYAQYRFPAMAAMPGCIAARKLVTVAGWANHSVLYEFTSLEEREKHFQDHESLALDKKEWTNRIIGYTVHAPGSPSLGRRLWPKVETGA